MERYISVDAGKFGTKVAEYLKEKILYVYSSLEQKLELAIFVMML